MNDFNGGRNSETFPHINDSSHYDEKLKNYCSE